MSFEPSHAEAVLTYEKAMRERNRLLKDMVRDAHWYTALERQMAEAGAEIADFIQYATPNAAARKLLDADYNTNPAIFPPRETIERCEVATYNGPEYTRMIDEAYTRIMAA